MNIIEPLAKTKTGKRFIFLVTDRYSKLTRTIPAKKTIATDVARIYVDEWAAAYDILDWLLTSNGPQFAEKLFNAVCLGLGTKLTTTTAYNLQTNVQTEQYSKNILSQPGHYINEHKDDCDTFFQPLT